MKQANQRVASPSVSPLHFVIAAAQLTQHCTLASTRLHFILHFVQIVYFVSTRGALYLTEVGGVFCLMNWISIRVFALLN